MRRQERSVNISLYIDAWGKGEEYEEAGREAECEKVSMMLICSHAEGEGVGEESEEAGGEGEEEI